jgi:hypothetical protein
MREIRRARIEAELLVAHVREDRMIEVWPAVGIV